MSRMLRASAIMAAGTLVSRLTGFLRTAILASAIGVAVLGDAYNVAYTIPFVLFDLLIGGVLSSVVVPAIVRHQKHDPDGGRKYEQRLLTAATVALTLVAVLAVVFAKPLVQLYADDLAPNGLAAAVTLARFILPQIAFFGIGAVAGAILNTRDRFAAPMWAPVLNNLVVIGVGTAYLLRNGTHEVDLVTQGELLLLGLGTTAGIVAQSIVLVIALIRAGFRFRPRFDIWNAGLGELGRLAVWTLVFVAINQVGFVVTTRLATGAGTEAAAAGVDGRGLTPYSYAFQLFQLPYGIIAVSVITAMLPRLSRFVTDGELDSARAEFASAVRTVSAVIIPAGLLLMVLGPSVTVLIFGRGAVSTEQALYIGHVLQVFGVALVPFSIFQLLLRVFYSFGDTRTPALIAGVNMLVNAAIGVTLYLILPPEMVVMGLAGSFTVTYLVGAALTWLLASRRVGGLGGRLVLSGLSRMLLAAIPAALVALLVLWGAVRLTPITAISSAAVLAVGGGLAGLVYLLVAQWLRINEVGSIIGMVTRRVGR
ncbi:murein biosynthesis integral membrane protein MurJ [Acrocarpospora catenulata]|uniref:murein biosynthesis integral membrane protein MurJ n=1 Tax=Acrocarpospora catenulata TaxID=2836182 RepID=UPI001BDAD399|nr:murein biosynthesis integral membrane protein MurJ [Acrocarpospora catenulata]